MNGKGRQRKTIIIFFILAIFLLVAGGVGVYKAKSMNSKTEESFPVEIEKEAPDQKIKPDVPKRTPNLPQPEEPEEETIDLQEEENLEIIEETEIEDLAEERVEPFFPSEKELSPVYISHCKSLFRNRDRHDETFLQNPLLTPEQRIAWNIDKAKANVNFQNIPTEQLHVGKIYYEDENGVLRSFLYRSPENIVREYLVSYDPEGFYVDCVEIGLIDSHGEERKSATIAINKLSVFEEEEVTEYYITPHLQFNKGKTFSRL